MAGAAPLAELPLFHPLSSLLRGLTIRIWSVPVPETVEHPSTAALMVCLGTGTTSNTIIPLALLLVLLGCPALSLHSHWGPCLFSTAEMKKQLPVSALLLQRACRRLGERAGGYNIRIQGIKKSQPLSATL